MILRLFYDDLFRHLTSTKRWHCQLQSALTHGGVIMVDENTMDMPAVLYRRYRSLERLSITVCVSIFISASLIATSKRR